MYKGNKPCPQCGRPGHEASRYSVDSLCQNCREIFRAGVKSLEAQKTQSDKYYHVWIYPTYTGDVNACRLFFDSLKKVCSLIHRPDVNYGETLAIGSHNSNSISAIITDIQYEVIREMYDNGYEAIKKAHQSGVEEGSSLLIGLHTGKHTLSEFDERIKRRS